jgi:hypothetical protein
MANKLVDIVYIILFIGLIVFLDFTYLSHDFWIRLIVNILIVLVALVFYILFLNKL